MNTYVPSLVRRNGQVIVTPAKAIAEGGGGRGVASAGEVFGLIGPNDAGKSKSTLIKVLTTSPPPPPAARLLVAMCCSSCLPMGS
jgi:hypothetical protein